MENATLAAWLIKHTTVTDQPIVAGEAEEGPGQWMCTSLDNVCPMLNYVYNQSKSHKQFKQLKMIRKQRALLKVWLFVREGCA